jgi:hypothetical protein
VRLERRLLHLGVALLGLGVVVQEAHPQHLGAVLEDAGRVERAPRAVVDAQVGVVVRHHHVHHVVAVQVAEAHVLIERARHVAGLVAAGCARGVGREAGHRVAVGLHREDHVAEATALEALCGAGHQLERAVAVDVARRQAAQLVAHVGGEARQAVARGVVGVDLPARRHGHLEPRRAGQEVHHHGAAPDAAFHFVLAQQRAVGVPDLQAVVARDEDLHRVVAVEVHQRGRARPALVPAVEERADERGLWDGGAASAVGWVAAGRGEGRGIAAQVAGAARAAAAAAGDAEGGGGGEGEEERARHLDTVPRVGMAWVESLDGFGGGWAPLAVGIDGTGGSR